MTEADLTFFQQHLQAYGSDLDLPTETGEARALFVYFLTIRSIRDLLYKSDRHLIEDYSKKYIRDVLLIDINQVILGLRDYRGSEDRNSVRQAKEYVEYGLRMLYDADIAFSEQSDEDSSALSKEDKRLIVASLIESRNSLDKALGLLEFESIRQLLQKLDT